MTILSSTCRRWTSIASRVARPHPRAWNLRWSHNVPAAAPRSLTEVEKIILGNIKATGPLSFSTYMNLCLSHSIHGYYMNPGNEVFGLEGDFITSPEITQMFGEALGMWFVSQWEKFGEARPIRIIELGPGRGTLMDDILRIFARFGPKDSKTSVHLIETSPAMRSIQENKLRDRQNVDPHWHNILTEVQPSSEEYTLLVAHEFFDALPFHVIQKQENGWHEVLIATNEAEESEGDQKPTNPPLRRVLARQPSAPSMLLGHSSPRFKDLPIGTTLEVSPTSYRIAHKIGQLLSTDSKSPEGKPAVGGSGLIIDYGGDKAYGDSFRAFRNHKLVDTFHEPGNCDLTTNVDFAYLKEAMAGLVTSYGPLSQRDFLSQMGLNLRLQLFLKTLPSQAEREVYQKAVDRLVDPLGMGDQYQVLGITNRLIGDHAVWPFTSE